MATSICARLQPPPLVDALSFNSSSSLGANSSNASSSWNSSTSTTQSPPVQLADTRTLIAGSLVFLVTFPFVVLHIKWVPLGATGAVLVGSLLMVVTGVLTQQDVYHILGTNSSALYSQFLQLHAVLATTCWYVLQLLSYFFLHLLSDTSWNYFLLLFGTTVCDCKLQIVNS